MHAVAVLVDVAGLSQGAGEGRPGNLARQLDPGSRERLEDRDEGGRERRAATGWGPEVLSERGRPARPGGRHSRALTACPPNWLRSAASMRSANESSSRERKRVKSAAVIVQAGTD